jgi:hypothetical protein
MTHIDHIPQATTHTPGPWRVAYPLGRIEVVTDGPAVSCKKICGDVSQANAALIATAPALLELCETLARRLPELDDDDARLAGSEAVQVLAQLWPDLKTAIAKAAGRET